MPEPDFSRLMGENALHHWAMGHKRSFEVEGETLWVAPPE